MKIEKIHVKKGDQVKVISGQQKGFLGVISSVLKKKSSVILTGLLPRIKYVKNVQTSNQNQESKKIEIPLLIHVSNVMLWDKTINKASRIGYKSLETTEKDIKKVEKKRYFRKSGNFV
jgi:large subunit ribosomal protein L24